MGKKEDVREERRGKLVEDFPEARLALYIWGIGCLDTVERNSNLNLTLERRKERDRERERSRYRVR